MHMSSFGRAIFAALVTLTPCACFEEVPDVSASSGDTGSATDASTSDATTAGATTGTSTATTGATGTTTGPGTCLPSGAAQTIDCGAGQTCTPDTQACCYTFIGVPAPQLGCGCPDACGPNASEFRCDGPEDCPSAEVCCAVFDGAKSRASCMSEIDCFGGPMGGFPLCHSVAECPPGPGSVCAGATVFPDIPNHMGICAIDDYAACTSPLECPDSTSACASADNGGSACARGCDTAGECPPPISGEPLAPSCIEGFPTSTGKACAFECQGDAQCPMGMACRLVQTDSGSFQLCVHP